MDLFNSLIDYLGAYPYIAVFLGFCLILFFIPIAEEFILFSGGFLSYKQGGQIWLPTLIAGIAGVFITDYWYYIWFRFFGKRLLATKLGRYLLPENKQLRYTEKVRRYGALMVVFVRFIPGGIRNPVFSICGLSGLPQLKFIAASLGTAVFSSQITFWLGYFFGGKIESFDQIIAKIEGNARIVILSVVAIIAIVMTVRWLRRRRKTNIHG